MFKNKIRELPLSEGEKIVGVIHQGKILLYLKLSIPSAIIILTFFFLFFLFSLGDKGILLFFALLAFGLILFARIYYIWNNRILVITNQKLIDIDQKGVRQRVVSNILLDKIADVYYQTKGFWQIINRLGTIYISLNDDKSGFEFKNLTSPQKIQQQILRLKADLVNDKTTKSDQTVKELTDRLNKLKAYLGEEKFNVIVGQD
ncbi:MAG: hypothetical protein WCX71_00565 [Candidatus Buchananbacteria bacterium]